MQEFKTHSVLAFRNPHGNLAHTHIYIYIYTISNYNDDYYSRSTRFERINEYAKYVLRIRM